MVREGADQDEEQRRYYRRSSLPSSYNFNDDVTSNMQYRWECISYWSDNIDHSFYHRSCQQSLICRSSLLLLSVVL